MTEPPRNSRQQDPEPPRRRLSVWEITKSTLAAAIGVQSEQARRRDFSHGRAAPFVIAGIIGTAVFVLVLVAVVKLVLSTAR